MIAGLVVLVQITPVLLIAGVCGVLGSPEGPVYAGMFLWLLALQLAVGIVLSSRYQGVAPAVYVLLCALVGRIDSAVQPWAWPLAEVGPQLAILLGGGAFLVAVCLLGALGLHD
ncbi:hypothetical protein [Microbacterium sp.]|uniref:hypothetical protein n=1 Tax=Microbacterium sp. TaxID=51671 RepID=UPI003A8808EC